MFQKTWQTVYRDIEITVKNSWNFWGGTTEEVWINGRQVHFYQTRCGVLMFFRAGLKRMLGYCRHFDVDGTRITVKVGSGKAGTTMACQILIDGEYYDGDKQVYFADCT